MFAGVSDMFTDVIKDQLLLEFGRTSNAGEDCCCGESTAICCCQEQAVKYYMMRCVSIITMCWIFILSEN